MIPKFRAWHKKVNVICEVLELNIAHEEVVVLHNDDIDTWFTKEFELMQWTGLKDISGKDIYVGDILEYRDSETWLDGSEYTIEIKFSSERGGFYREYTDKEWDMLPYKNSAAYELMGNIYENPELLKNNV